MRDIRILPTSDAEQFTAGLFAMFTRSVEAQRALIASPEFETCSVCGVSLPMGEEFDEHCCCGRGAGRNPDCQKCNP